MGRGEGDGNRAGPSDSERCGGAPFTSLIHDSRRPGRPGLAEPDRVGPGRAESRSLPTRGEKGEGAKGQGECVGCVCVCACVRACVRACVCARVCRHRVHGAEYRPKPGRPAVTAVPGRVREREREGE